MTNNNINQELGRMLKRQRLIMTLTLRELATKAGVSPSHLGRIERGERYPSAPVLRKLAKPLDFEEAELFSLAGYLSQPAAGISEKYAPYGGGHLDPYVSQILSWEPVEVQRAILGILSVLKSIAKTLK